MLAPVRFAYLYEYVCMSVYSVLAHACMRVRVTLYLTSLHLCL